MSFFDDEPPTRQARPRRPAGPRSGGATTGTRARAAASGPEGDPQQLMMRRAAALGIGALLLILIVLGFRGCLNSRTDNALKDYNRNVGAIVGDSNDQVSARLFELLAGGQNTTVTDLEQNVNQVRVTADEDLKRARALDVPGDMKDAHYSLLEVLTFRADGVKQIAEDLPSIEGDQAEDAANRIAGQMSAFLASDVIYATRVAPFLTETLVDQDIAGQTTPASQFLPDAQWLDPAFVRKQLTGKGAGKTSGDPAPGTHGHGLLGVAVGTTNLVADTTNRVAGGSNPTFNVKFANQGENDEFDVTVKVTVTNPAGDPIDVKKSVDQTATGAAEIVVPVGLGDAPPEGPVRVTVEVVPVPGEVNTDNNKATYTIIFSG
ncbi:MAG: hypothetical protein WKF96_06380 [Solirubrobacteraceae bacterium]